MSATQFKTQAIADDAVTTAKIPNNAITTSKIADAQITQPKLAAGVGGNADHSFKIRKSGQQAIGSSAYVIVLWDIDQFDTDDLHSVSINTDKVTFTALTAGKWLFTLNAVWGGGAASGQKIERIFKNGGDIGGHAGQHNNGGAQVNNLSAIINIAAGDYVQVEVYNGSSSSENFGDASIGTVWFGGIRIAT